MRNLLLLLLWFTASCSNDRAVEYWITKGDKSALLQQQPAVALSKKAPDGFLLDLDSTKRYQEVEGFGFTLTGASAALIHQLPAEQRSALLKELFGNDDSAIGINFLRISIGASDLSTEVFTYHGDPLDTALTSFSLSHDTVHLVPLLKEILQVNPDLHIMGTPWTAPLWMKDNGRSVGGKLLPRWYGAYARYLVRYIEAMKANGITVHAITPQNEPLHGGNDPSMVMQAEEQATFIRDHLGPAFRAAGIDTRIIVYDHNADKPEYPITILNDTAARKYVDGSAFHLYGGDISALGKVHEAHPDKKLYFTEQWTSSKGAFAGDLSWHIRNVIIGSMRNHSRIALEWNLANDTAFAMHTPGGCTECKGALTIGKGIERNVAYYIVAHASKFIPRGSVRIASPAGHLANVAFLRPDGKVVLMVLNDSPEPQTFIVRLGEHYAELQLPASSVGTFIL